MIFAKIMELMISVWAYKQVKLMIQTYRDINSLEGLNDEDNDPRSSV